jgi:uncharacterized membrane protein YccF (DUF307 family)
VRVLLNLIWLVFGGLVLALGCACDVHPDHHDPVRDRVRADRSVLPLAVRPHLGPASGRRGSIGDGNVIWFVLAGWWLAIGHVITGVLMCLTIIGIPLGLANFKLIPVSLTPIGRDIVDLAEARRLGLHTDVAVPADPARR